jgi:hypothetical protein
LGRQTEDAADQVERELQDFESRRREALQELDLLDEAEVMPVEGQQATQGGEEESKAAIASEAPKEEETNEDRSPTMVEDEEGAPPRAVDGPVPDDDSKANNSSEPVGFDDEMDVHHGETVVEAEEDTVIY